MTYNFNDNKIFSNRRLFIYSCIEQHLKFGHLIKGYNSNTLKCQNLSFKNVHKYIFKLVFFSFLFFIHKILLLKFVIFILKKSTYSNSTLLLIRIVLSIYKCKKLEISLLMFNQLNNKSCFQKISLFPCNLYLSELVKILYKKRR